jgi:hypothetical protein
MARCKEIITGRKRFFHTWREWSYIFQALYRGKDTLVQQRTCLYCKKIQIKEL